MERQRKNKMDKEWKILSEKITSPNTMETIYVSKRGKKEKRLKVVYHHIQPKNEEEAREQQRSVDSAFEVLFDAVLEKRKKESTPTPNTYPKASLSPPRRL